MTDDEEALKLADSLIRKHSSHFPGHPLRCEEEQLGLHVRRLVEEKRALRTDLLEALDLLDSLHQHGMAPDDWRDCCTVGRLLTRVYRRLGEERT